MASRGNVVRVWTEGTPVSFSLRVRRNQHISHVWRVMFSHTYSYTFLPNCRHTISQPRK